MKVALADKPAVPFRVPPGIKLIRVDLKTGVRAGPGDPKVILEAFKPGTAPPDNGAVVGYGDSGDGGAAGRPPFFGNVRPTPSAPCARAPAACIDPLLILATALRRRSILAYEQKSRSGGPTCGQNFPG